MADGLYMANFACQRCSQPLKLDESLHSLSEHVLAELHLPVHSIPDVDLESEATSFDHFVHPCRLSDSGNGANGFMLISDEHETEVLSQRERVKAALFDTLSGNSYIDHPLCEECTDYLIEIQEEELIETGKDYEDYNNYYKSLQSETDDAKLSDLEKELSDLKAEEHRLVAELEALTKEEEETEELIKKQIEETAILQKQERKYFEEYSKFRQEYMRVNEEARSLENQLHHSQLQLDKLKNTNVFNATFHIWHEGHFGTINNLRLGRLPGHPVAWNEINAAWGQTVLLLTALARKLGLTFERYKLVPFGNHSYVEVLEDGRELPLHGSGGFRFVWDTKFDAGMVAFMDCLQQFQECVEKREECKGNRLFRFPYRTTAKGKIEDTEASYSIKIQLNSEEQWTKAAKFMLTNLKWGLAWMASQFDGEGVDVSLEEGSRQPEKPPKEGQSSTQSKN